MTESETMRKEGLKNAIQCFEETLESFLKSSDQKEKDFQKGMLEFWRESIHQWSSL